MHTGGSRNLRRIRWIEAQLASGELTPAGVVFGPQLLDYCCREDEQGIWRIVRSQQDALAAAQPAPAPLPPPARRPARAPGPLSMRARATSRIAVKAVHVIVFVCDRSGTY